MSFENQIQQWVQLDNQLNQLNNTIKQLRENRNVLEQNITNYVSLISKTLYCITLSRAYP